MKSSRKIQSKSSLLQTDTKNFQQLIEGNVIYEIPRFQRDYSWQEEHWEDLWDDITYMLENKEQHYMGTIVLKGGDDKYIVIDGQQRIVTLSILAMAIIMMIEELPEKGKAKKNSEQRAEV